ncbi:MAG: phosphoadenosine phosphosulfate reductase family protein [Hyphomicrobiaceae bacterium]
MPLLPAVRSVTSGLNTADMLRFLIEERFPGKTVVTASLRSSSIVVLKMVADIDPATPVVFCQVGSFFPDSQTYRDQIVAHLGLTNVTTSTGSEPLVREKDCTHCERMWAEYEDRPGRSFEIIHLNDTLAPYDCWISAVYHTKRPAHVRDRVDKEGRLIWVDPLVRWSRDDVRAFMKEHGIPYHKRAYREKKRIAVDQDAEPVETWAF